MDSVKVHFDLKFSSLEQKHWERRDNKKLAYQLYTYQGQYRDSVENRLFIVFENSSTSSASFLERNEIVMLREVVKMLEDPAKYWFKLSVRGEEVLTCLILIPEVAYVKVMENYHHSIGLGLREEEKAQFAHKFLQHAALIADGKIEPYENPKAHGVDAYIYLLKEVVEKQVETII